MEGIMFHWRSLPKKLTENDIILNLREEISEKLLREKEEVSCFVFDSMISIWILLSL
jgi:hypothetical protein